MMRGGEYQLRRDKTNGGITLQLEGRISGACRQRLRTIPMSDRVSHRYGGIWFD